MQGSDKQVAWAGEIKGQWAKGIIGEIESASRRAAEGTMPQIWADLWETHGRRVLGQLEAVGAAKWYIDRRDLRMVDLTKDEVAKMYDYGTANGMSAADVLSLCATPAGRKEVLA